jgi:2-hydroxychromene-2-carboxylate isomerase
MPLSFAVTWDYRCPFARNLHDQVVEGLLDRADWDVTFVPFSLGQVHVGEGETDVWDEPERDSGLLALRAGVVVRDQYPDRFLVAHRELFNARHVHGRKIADREVVADVLHQAGVDADSVLAEIDGGEPLDIVRKEHEAAVADFDVWGVPTVIAGAGASFIRVMNDAGGDPAGARQTIERVVDLLTGWPELNEFKHTSLER